VNDRAWKALGALAAMAAVTSPELSYAAVKARVRDAAKRDPFDSTIATVLVASYLFFRAEKGHNPKVETFGDALVFISTCLSVGYSDIFARTEAGKAIATAVMTFGPALTASILDEPGAAAKEAAAVVSAQAAVVDKLDAILDELRLQRA
jgi:voltage-gated potassium channel